MGSDKEEKRKKDKRDGDDENLKERKSKRARTRSRSPVMDNRRDSGRKRRHSRSVSADRLVKQERQRDPPRNETEVKQETPVRKNKETDMLNTRTGGAYIPPARLRMMQAQITDKSSVPYQRLAWEALKKSIHGHINKINIGNIGIIIKELLKENIVRGRGLLCRSVIQAQAASPTFTNVYAALVAAVNSRFPNIGELLLKRLVIQFKRGFKRNDKPICISSALFIAHLVNQRVAHEILALELLTLLVETPTDDSVEVSIAFLKECGQKLTEVSSKGVNAIFEMLRNILHEGQLDKRVQYMIEVMFQVWKDGFKDHPAVIEELELVPEEEQFTHLLMLDDATDAQDILNVFKFDEKYEENEQKYKTLSKEILGSDAESDGEEGSGESGSEGSEEEEEEQEQKPMTIIDKTETNLIALRRTVYLTINSSLDFEECAHKLMKMQLKPGQEVELCHMFLDCCAEQRTYEKFYGLLAQRFCNINKIYIGPFEEIFKDSYGTAHRLDTNRLRNVSKFFAHLLFTDSISWEVLECVKLNEEDTTSSSRIYIKILFQELAEYMGLKKLNDRLQDPTLQEAFRGVFPRDNPKNTRFSINFFTSIGLGGLTDELREHLKQMPKAAPAPLPDLTLDSSSSDSSSSSSSSSSDSESDEEEGGKKDKTKSKKKTPKPPEEEPPKDKNDRWGHDGFHETYGKDARRIEPREHIFARPRDVRDDRTIDQRNGGDERNKRDNFWGDKRQGDSRRDSRSDGRSDKSEKSRDDRNSQEDSAGRRERRTDDDQNNRLRERRRDDDRNDRRKERGKDDHKNTERRDRRKDYDGGREERRRDGNDDRQRTEKHKDERSRERDDKIERRGNEKDREEKRKVRDDDKRKYKEDTRGKRDNTEIETHNDDYDFRTKKQDDHRSRRDVEVLKDKERTKEEDRSKKNKKKELPESDSSSSDETNHDNENRRTRRDKKEIGRADLEVESRSKKDERRSRKDDDRYKNDSRNARDDDKRKQKEDTKAKRNDGETERSKKKKRDTSESDSSSSKSSDESNHEKENRNDKHKSKRDKREKGRADSDSEEDSRSKKDKRRSKNDDGWDIRGNSIRREVTSRYWEN